MRTPKAVLEHMARIGRKGGKAKSQAKTEAARRNIRLRWVGKNQMFCHRHPPAASLVPGPKGGMIAALCAPVTPEMWCGEAKTAEEDKCPIQ